MLGGLTALGASLLALTLPQVLAWLVNGPLLTDGSRAGVFGAAAVYAGFEPLVADDIADAVAWTVSRPPHVNIDLLVVRPRAQASNTKTSRRPD